MPTWESEVELAADGNIGDGELYTKFYLYYRYFAGKHRRQKLIVFFKNGTIEILSAIGYSTTADGETGVIFLERDLTVPLRRIEIRMISFLGLWRLASDDMVIDYETNQVGSVKLSMQEVDG